MFGVQIIEFKNGIEESNTFIKGPSDYYLVRNKASNIVYNGFENYHIIDQRRYAETRDDFLSHYIMIGRLNDRNNIYHFIVYDINDKEPDASKLKDIVSNDLLAASP